MNFLKNLFGSQTAEAKNLVESKAQIAAAKTNAEAVAALFSAVPLDLDALLAAGPDSLKAHIEGVSAKDGELAAAQSKIVELEEKLSAAEANALDFKSRADSTVSLLTAVGFVPVATATEADAKAAFAAHVSKAAALELAKGGHAPVADIPPPPAKGEVAPIDPNLKGYDRYKADFERQIAARARK